MLEESRGHRESMHGCRQGARRDIRDRESVQSVRSLGGEGMGKRVSDSSIIVVRQLGVRSREWLLLGPAVRSRGGGGAGGTRESDLAHKALCKGVGVDELVAWMKGGKRGSGCIGSASNDLEL